MPTQLSCIFSVQIVKGYNYNQRKKELYVQGREGEIERGKRQGFFQHHLMGPTPKCSALLTQGFLLRISK